MKEQKITVIAYVSKELTYASPLERIVVGPYPMPYHDTVDGVKHDVRYDLRQKGYAFVSRHMEVVVK